jgi:hypothetical protein
MFASPWILAFAMEGGTAARTAWFLGAGIVIFASLAVYLPKTWEEAINILFGICLLASPWTLSYSDQTRATASAVIVGLLVTAFGTWAMLMDTAVQRWWRERHL